MTALKMQTPELALDFHACMFYDVGKAIRIANTWQRDATDARGEADGGTAMAKL